MTRQVNVNVTREPIVAKVDREGINVQVNSGIGPRGPAGEAGATDYTQLTNRPAWLDAATTYGQSILAAASAAAAKVLLSLTKSDVGLGNVDNTSDAAKPISTATQAALDGKQVAGTYATLVAGKVPETQLPPIVTTWEGLQGKPSSFPPSSHNHDDRYYTQTQTDALLAGKQAAGSYATLVGGKVPSEQLPTIVTSYNDLTNKPDLSVYLTSVSWNDVQSKPSFAQVATSGAYSDLSGKPTLGTAAAANTGDFAPAGTYATLVGGTVPDSQIASNIARTSDVTSAVAAVVNAAPASLDTLKELAAALGNDASFATTVTNTLATKAPINNPTFTGTVGGITKSMVGLGNVDNTSDANKPVSTAQAAADAAVASAAAADATSKANAAQAAAVQRANHTGTQAWSTIDSTPMTLSGYGITDAVGSSDSRLTDTRTPTDGSVTDAKIASGGLSASVLNWAAIQPWAANTAYTKGDLVHYLGVAYRRSSTGTSGPFFNTSNWQQVTPSTYLQSQISGLQAALDAKQASGSYVLTSDSRLTDARPPTGSAGGSLSGTYPNPTLAAGSVGTTALSDGSVTTGKVANSAVTIAKLSATGTADSSTFLRGDGQWASVISTSIDGGSATTSDGGVVDGGSATTV